MNNCIFMGRLTQEPELKQTSNGVSYLNFTIAVDRRQSKDAEKKADFVPCVAWRGTGETISKYFHKGDGIIVAGRMENDPYEKDGIKVQSWKCVCDQFSFPIGKKSSAPVEASAPVFTPVEDSGDLPF